MPSNAATCRTLEAVLSWTCKMMSALDEVVAAVAAEEPEVTEDTEDTEAFCTGAAAAAGTAGCGAEETEEPGDTADTDPTDEEPAEVAVVAAMKEEEEAGDEDDDMRAVVAGDGDGLGGLVMTFHGTRAASSRNRSVRKRKGVLPEEAADPPPACQRSESEGPFWFEAPRTIVVTDPETGKKRPRHKGITSRERQRLREMLKAGFITEALLRDVVVPMNDETSAKARLRAHDHALTNWLKGQPRLKLVTHADGVTELVDISVDYERQLGRDHRLLLDPFRRGTHLFFEVDGRTHYTTAGQLTYIRFGVDYDVHGYVEEHEDRIREQMKEAAKSKPALQEDGRRRRRRELTKQPSAYCRGAIFAEYDIITNRAEELEAARVAQAALCAKALGMSAVAAGLAASADSADDEAVAGAGAAAAVGKTVGGGVGNTGHTGHIGHTGHTNKRTRDAESGEEGPPTKRARVANRDAEDTLDTALDALPVEAII